MKKTLCMILAAMMLASAFVSCSDNKAENTPDDTAPAAGDTAASADETVPETLEEEEVISDDLPEITFDGHEYKIYNTNPETNTWYTTVHVTFEEDTGEPITSAIFYRNIAVEDRFDVKISEIEHTAAEAKAVITAGTAEDMDLVLLDGGEAIGLIQSQMVYDYNTVEYINLDKPYWDQNARKYLSIANKYYGGVGDFLTTTLDETVCMFFNRALLDAYQLEDPYELVDNMKWTLDKFAEMGATVSNDTNGDGIFTDQDRYSLLGLRFNVYPMLIYGSGESYVKKDENDAPYISISTDRFTSVFEKVVDICHSDGDHFFYDADITANTMGLSSNHRVQEIMFPNDQALFWVECICWARELRAMEEDFGLVVPPMYNEEQGQYYSFHHGRFYGPQIPVTLVGESLDRCAIILEALNSHSTNTVLKAYYDVSLENKIARDEETGKHLDLIFETLTYDTSIVYDIASIDSGLYTMASENKKDVASYAKKNQKIMKKQIEKIVEKISGMEE
ncbi:MAG: hypothetical protein IJ302_04880 [Clostridia bacterium]|nr:hypothetical protein [Clostridia bacterium]